MRRVYRARDPADAHLAAGALEQEGIDAEVRGEHLWSVRGEVPLTPETCPSVWVADDQDAARAEALLAALRREDPAGVGDGEPWTCAACGEVGEPGFGACWRCGAARPG